MVVFKGFSNDVQLAPFASASRELRIGKFRSPSRAWTWMRMDSVCGSSCTSTSAFSTPSASCKATAGFLKLRDALTAGVGLVGATGSFESMYSDLTARQQKEVAKHLHTRARRAWKRFRKGLVFERFPNPHLRTNAFMISGELMRRLWPRKIGRKRAAHALESGKQSITRRVQKLGLKVLIVGRDGVGYEPERWPVSGIFWQAEQENLPGE